MTEDEKLRAQVAGLLAAVEMHDFLLQNLYALGFKDRPRDFEETMKKCIRYFEQPPTLTDVRPPQHAQAVVKHLNRFQVDTRARI